MFELNVTWFSLYMYVYVYYSIMLRVNIGDDGYTPIMTSETRPEKTTEGQNCHICFAAYYGRVATNYGGLFFGGGGESMCSSSVVS